MTRKKNRQKITIKNRIIYSKTEKILSLFIRLLQRRCDMQSVITPKDKVGRSLRYKGVLAVTPCSRKKTLLNSNSFKSKLS